jgi:carboxymethylenebutenolidase
MRKSCGSTFLAGLAAICALALGACGSQEAPAPAPAAPAAAAPAVAQQQEEIAAAPAPTGVALLEQEVAYGEAQRSNLVGFLAMPGDAAEPLPGIIVIHEWWGLNDEIKALARRLASERYIVLAVDLYGGAMARTPEQAQELMAGLFAEPEAVRKNLQQAYDYLDKYALAPRIGSIGWGLGGGWSLQAALLLPDSLDATVMYYGQVVTDRTQLATLRMPLLGFFGADDRSVPVREVQEFRATLLDLGKSAEVLIVSDANQSFASANSPNYNEAAATDAWKQAVAFLSRNLQLATATQ